MRIRAGMDGRQHSRAAVLRGPRRGYFEAALVLGLAGIAVYGIGCGSSTGTLTPPPGGGSGVTITVPSNTASVPAGMSRTFTATVTGSTNTTVLWFVQEGAAGGTITAQGLYTAPDTLGTYTVVAVAAADTSQKQLIKVTVTSASGQQIATVANGGTNGIAVNPATNRIYGAETAANRVSVIDGVSKAVIGTLPVPNATGVAVNPATNRIYVSDGLAGTGHVYVFDGYTGTQLAKLNVGDGPVRVAVNPVTNKIYVANQSTQSASGGLTVIDGATNSTTTLLPGFQASCVAVNSNTNRIYLTQQTTFRLYVLNGDTNSILANVQVGAAPRGIAVNEAANRVYVTNSSGNSVTVIDGATNVVATTVRLAQAPGIAFPYDAAVDSVLNKVWIANANVGSTGLVAYLLNGANNNVTPVTVTGSTIGAAVNPSTHRVYFTGGSRDEVFVVDGS